MIAESRPIINNTKPATAMTKPSLVLLIKIGSDPTPRTFVLERRITRGALLPQTFQIRILEWAICYLDIK